MSTEIARLDRRVDSLAQLVDAQANQHARAAPRGGSSTSAGLASQPAPLSRPAVLSPPVLKPATRPAPLRPASTTVSPSFPA